MCLLSRLKNNDPKISLATECKIPLQIWLSFLSLLSDVSVLYCWSKPLLVSLYRMMVGIIIQLSVFKLLMIHLTLRKYIWRFTCIPLTQFYSNHGQSMLFMLFNLMLIRSSLKDFCKSAAATLCIQIHKLWTKLQIRIQLLFTFSMCFLAFWNISDALIVTHANEYN